MKNKFRLFVIRLKTCFEILFIYEHWFIVNMKSEDMSAMQGAEDFDIDIIRHKMVGYNVYQIVEQIYHQKDDADRILDKADFQAQVYEFSLTKKRNP